MADERREAPRFSVVSAVYNVARYLPDFLRSLERQDIGMDELDIILVDDGSTDESRALCEAFAERWPDSARVVTKQNGGQGSARNLGLGMARGEWVTFTDPDDYLHPDYFQEVARFLSDAPESPPVQMLSTSIVTFDEETGEHGDTHPLQRKFRYGNRIVDLELEPDCLQMSGATAIFRRAEIERNQLRFDDRVRPNFEDGHFIARYLLLVSGVRIGLVASAKYVYRRRADGTSTLDTTRGHPSRYTAVPRYGFLAVLQLAEKLHGGVPEWVQCAVIYNLAWNLKGDSAIKSQTGSLTAEVQQEYHRLVAEIRPYLAAQTIERFAVIPISTDMRFALLHGYFDDSVHERSVAITGQDIPRGLVRLEYRFTGTRPREEAFVDSVLAEPVHTKDWSLVYFGRTLASRRILWLPLGNRTSIRLDGRLMPIGEHALSTTILERHVPIGRSLRVVNDRAEALRHPSESLLSRVRKGYRVLRQRYSRQRLALFVETTMISLGLHSARVRRRYKNAWVFMDRVDFANDNAEHLYRYVKDSRPELNSWFVLNKSSPDWARLRGESFRLVAYGSTQWKLLVLSAVQVASSHADLFVTAPPALAKFGPSRWRFSYLRHGVMANDQSRWLNSKTPDLLISASLTEYHQLVDDGTPYRYTTKEARLTGFPRHDALIAKRERTSPAERDLLLIMPTWRSELKERPNESDAQRQERFRQTAFAHEFAALVGSRDLRLAADANGLTLAFMPHPNLTPFLSQFEIPDGVRVFTFDRSDVQALLARAAAVITDYSSLAFEAARIRVPVAYFQFDDGEIFSGYHAYRRGSFDYVRDGFGPVFSRRGDLEKWVESAVQDWRPVEPYLSRMNETFAFDDMDSSRRVLEQMLKLDQLEPRVEAVPRAARAAADAGVA